MSSQLRPETEGGNGSHAPARAGKPEVAANPSGALNVSSSLRSKMKPHATLVIERGQSMGKQ
ncbi:MAG TPA: hypothetical protein VJ180_02075, partial [Pyrinomonadaceae bacterium]|nr:hypothetical protein [Pyrinomonadaceae bacterium]